MGPNGGSLLVCFKKINKINVLKKYIFFKKVFTLSLITFAVKG